MIGAMLVALFLLWLYTAQSIYTGLFGDQPPASIERLFVQQRC